MNGIRVIRAVPLLRVNKGFISLDWIWQSWQETSDCDTVIINLPGPDGLITALLARIRGNKILVIYHCDVIVKNKLIERIVDNCSRIVMRLANRVVTNTQDYAETSRVLPEFKNKTEYIYPIIKEVKSKKVRNKIFTIGWIGRIAREKGLEYLLEAIPILEQKMKFRLLLAGPKWTAGEEIYQKRILDLVEEHKSRVVMAGEIPEEKIIDFYSQVDVLALPSINATETLGMVQLEAMMAGIPVVASNLPGVRQPIKTTGMGILVPPKDSLQLAESIYNIYKNKNDYKDYKELSRKLFGPEKGLDRFEKLLIDQTSK